MDYTQQEAHLNAATEFHKDLNARNDPSPTATCQSREPDGSASSMFAFFPAFAADVSEANPHATYSGTCFEEITFDFAKTSDTSFDVTVTTDKPKSTFCSDLIMFGNTEIQHFEIFFFKGAHKVSFHMNTEEAQYDVGYGGIKAWGFCEGIKGSIESLWNTVKAFVGGVTDHPDWPIIGSHVPKYMELANVRFLKEANGWDLQPRATQKVEIDPSLIKSGDFFGVMRLDGLDPMIMYGTGAKFGHNVMALRMENDELYIVESQDAWYWPTHGLQRTKWADWLKQAEDADYHVTWHRMREEIRQNFDVQKAIDFFNDTEGLPYGYHNFLYGWIDSAEDNWPPLLPKQLVPVVFSMIEQIKPDLAFNFFAEALNFRLGTTGLTIEQIAEAAAKKNMGVDDVMAMPEIDGWEYTGEKPRDGRSWVCSAYVTAVFKAAGIFGDMDINSTEFATQDVYEMNLWDVTTPLPEACQQADPNLPYCQILGKYQVVLDYYNTVTPYEHMNETCNVNWPSYTRDEGC